MQSQRMSRNLPNGVRWGKGIAKRKSKNKAWGKDLARLADVTRRVIGTTGPRIPGVLRKGVPSHTWAF